MGPDPLRVVVGYDGSPDADAGLLWAIEECRRQPATLVVVVVASGMDPVLSEYHEISERRAQEWREQAEKTLREARAAGAVEIRHGTAYPALTRAAGPGDLLVVGSHGHGQATGIVTGSVSQHVVRKAPCPVVVARPVQDAAARRIVVGSDGSAASDAALRWAFARAAATGEELHAVTACPSVPPERERAKDLRRNDQARLDLAVFRLRRQLSPLRQAAGGVRVCQHVVAGSTSSVLEEHSEHASLVVVGTRGRDPFAELVLGSTAQHLLRRAHCPVAVVRRWPPPEEDTDAAPSRERDHRPARR
jgi:nucleotide-binding universal stress UspA family protein